MSTEIDKLRQQLIHLTELRDAAVVTSEQFAQGAALLERRILDQALQDAASPTAHPASTADIATAVRPVTATPAVHAGARRLDWKWRGTLLVLVAALGIGAYVWLRPAQTALNGRLPALASGTASTPMQAPPHTTDQEQIGPMVEKLAARLKNNPKDAVGWAMLARSYSVMGNIDQAVQAYERATALSPADAGLLVDYADALAVKNQRVLGGAPMKLVQRALKLEPRNVKALALAGTDAFDRKDYRAAVTLWEQVIAIGGPDNLFAKEVLGSLEEARSLAGMPSRPSAPVAASGDAGGSASGGPSVAGTVRLAAKLLAQTSPEETVFITARPSTGSRMPLAVLRRQVKDFPIAFRLDDSLAMSAQTKITSATEVIVTARVSKAGTAMPMAGDLVVQSPPIRLGSDNVQLEINETVNP